MSPDAVRHKASLPAIVDHKTHRHAMPFRLVRRRPQQLGRQHIMTIGDDIRTDDDLFAHQALNRESAAGHQRLNRLDTDALRLQTGRLQVRIDDLWELTGSVGRISQGANLTWTHS